MKRIFAIYAITLLSTLACAQTTYEVKVLGTSYTQQQIDQAFTSAEFCGYIKESEPVIIVLDDGASIELKPASALTNVDPACAKPNSFVFQEATWKISDSGIIQRILPTNFVKQRATH